MVEDSFGRVKPRPGRNVHAGDDDVGKLRFVMICAVIVKQSRLHCTRRQ